MLNFLNYTIKMAKKPKLFCQIPPSLIEFIGLLCIDVWRSIPLGRFLAGRWAFRGGNTLSLRGSLTIGEENFPDAGHKQQESEDSTADDDVLVEFAQNEAKHREDSAQVSDDHSEFAMGGVVLDALEESGDTSDVLKDEQYEEEGS